MFLPRGLRSIVVSRLPDYDSPLRLPHRPATRLLIPASPWNIRADRYCRQQSARCCRLFRLPLEKVARRGDVFRCTTTPGCWKSAFRSD
jgi:hypothetical protein